MTKLSVWDLVEIAVDKLESCSSKVRENIILSQESGMPTTTASNSISGGGDKSELWFPFAEGIPFAATLWMGAEGFNGRHISSFQYRQVWMPSPIVIPNGLKSVKIFNLSPTSRILQCIAAGQLF
jgi:beta-1,3-galactosyltransferase